jgi:hypothetical protein
VVRGLVSALLRPSGYAAPAHLSRAVRQTRRSPEFVGFSDLLSLKIRKIIHGAKSSFQIVKRERWSRIPQTTAPTGPRFVAYYHGAYRGSYAACGDRPSPCAEYLRLIWLRHSWCRGAG